MQKLLAFSPHIEWHSETNCTTSLPDLTSPLDGELVSKVFQASTLHTIDFSRTANITEGKEYTSKTMTIQTIYYWVIYLWLKQLKQKRHLGKPAL